MSKDKWFKEERPREQVKKNASKPLEDHQIEQMWSSRTIGLQNPRSLLRLVWWNNVTHLGMRAFKEQYDCQIEYFTVSDEYDEYKERQTKNHQGAEGSSRKRARKSVQHQNMENRWRRERESSWGLPPSWNLWANKSRQPVFNRHLKIPDFHARVRLAPFWIH